MNPTRQYSHPLLWSFVLIAFVVMVAFFVRHWYQVGEIVGASHPRPTGGGGVEIPDHAAYISRLDEAVLDLGRAVYEGNCVSCHGVDGMAGVNGARLFPQEAFLNGADPYSQFLTLVRGYNLMPAQPMLSVEEKYAVTHYIRETFLREQNPDQYTAIDDDYLANGPWPAPGLGDGEAAHPYGANARAPLTVPVKALSSHAVRLAQPTASQRWEALLANSDLPDETRRALTVQRLSPFAAGVLLNALRDDDPEIFVLAAGDYLPSVALWPAHELIAVRHRLAGQVDEIAEEAPIN